MWLWDALTAPGGRGSARVWTGTGFVETPWQEVAAQAMDAAATLRRAGVRPGRVVAALLTNTPATMPGMVGVWLAGGTVASLPVPTPAADREAYGRHIASLVEKLDAPLVLAEERLSRLLPDSLRSRHPVRSWESLCGGGGGGIGGGRGLPGPPGDDEPAFIQFSSGSTSEPKGCVLTPRAIEKQLELILQVAAGTPGRETMSSWLPLSHDMGVFGGLLYPWAYDFRVVLSTPERFLLSPRTWFRDMAEYGATMTAGTNTALHLASRVQRSGGLPDRLRLRVCVVGAERIEWATLQRTTQTFAPYGLRPEVLTPAYGLAEAALAVTSVPVDQEPTALSVDGTRLADGEVVVVAPDVPSAVPIVSTGRPCRGVTVTLDDPSRLSEIRVSSPSLATGYFADERRTRAQFTAEGLRTGDLGFQHDGELYVVGRADDLLSVGGRNIYAGEIEGDIDSNELVRKGCVVLVDVPTGGGLRELVLLAELRRRDADYHGVAEHAAEIAMARAGVTLSECLFLPMGALPKTPSGKIQRFRCRQLIEQGALRPVARVTMRDG
jgi:fatty-acyl-CoA synthase